MIVFNAIAMITPIMKIIEPKKKFLMFIFFRFQANNRVPSINCSPCPSIVLAFKKTFIANPVNGRVKIASPANIINVAKNAVRIFSNVLFLFNRNIGLTYKGISQNWKGNTFQL